MPQKMLIGATYRSELAREVWGSSATATEKTHADGRFEVAGVTRNVIEAFSTRRAEIEAAMAERGAGATAENQRLAQRAALMTRAHKRDVDKAALRRRLGETSHGLGLRRQGPRGRIDGERRRFARRRTGRHRCCGRRSGPRSRGMGRFASIGARGGLLPRQSPRRRARLGPGFAVGMSEGGTRSRRDGEGGSPARGGLARSE